MPRSNGGASSIHPIDTNVSSMTTPELNPMKLGKDKSRTRIYREALDLPIKTTFTLDHIWEFSHLLRSRIKGTQELRIYDVEIYHNFDLNLEITLLPNPDFS